MSLERRIAVSSRKAGARERTIQGRVLRSEGDWFDVRDLARKALESGGELFSHPFLPPGENEAKRVQWDVSGRCIRPVLVDRSSRPGRAWAWNAGVASSDPEDVVIVQGLHVELLVPCRQCSECLKARAALWGRRAVTEWKAAPRTWFGTLTFRPEERYRLLLLTRQRLLAAGVELEKLPDVERFRELIRETGPCVTKMFKRMRKGLAGDPALRGSSADTSVPPLDIRYFLTVEPHKDFSPHYHLLVHEVDPLRPVKKRYLERYWPHGFVRWKLVEDEKAAFYAAKYLGKYSVSRVRNSEGYGEQAENVVKDLCESASAFSEKSTF